MDRQIKYNRSTLGHSVQCKPHTAHIHQSKLDQLIGMAPSRGCGVCKALFGIQVRSRERGKEKKKRTAALGMLQKPLEKGDVVEFSAHLERLLSGWGLTVCLTFLTVAQQCVQQLSNSPLLLPKSLDHCWELKGHTLIIHHQLQCSFFFIGVEWVPLNFKGFPISYERCTH